MNCNHLGLAADDSRRDYVSEQMARTNVGGYGIRVERVEPYLESARFCTISHDSSIIWSAEHRLGPFDLSYWQSSERYLPPRTVTFIFSPMDSHGLPGPLIHSHLPQVEKLFFYKA